MPSPKILVVDDERTIRELLIAVLTDEGYHAVGAATGRAALACLPQERPQLVLMDVSMPEMDGIEALRRIEADPDFAAVPVLLMSAAVGVDRVRGKGAGFLAKPFDLDRLLGTIADLLARPA